MLRDKSGDGSNSYERSIDPLEMEFFRYRIESVVDELDINITRTAHSPLVYEYKDYSVGVLTRDFKLLSQARYNLPIFIADLGEPVRDVVELIGIDRLEPGDVFITNYAPISGSHLNNVIAASPVYDLRGNIQGYVAIRTHWPDVGGLVPGSVSWEARHVFHEGVQYRGLKVASKGKIVPEVLATIQANSWSPQLVTGDLMSNVAACLLGVSRWREQIAERWTLEEVDALTEAQFAASAALATAKLRDMPEREYEASVEMDNSGLVGTPPLKLAITVRIADGRMTVDLSKFPPQVEAPINAGAYGGALSAVRVAFKSLFAPERPADEGLFAPLDLVIPDGTVMSATKGAPLGWWNQLVPTLIDLVLKAIGDVMPHRVPAGHFGGLTNVQLIGQRDDDEWWIMNMPAHGGHGAHSEGDGYGPLMSLMHGDNPMVASEILEARYPVRIISHRLRREAGGAGLHRGGPGREMIVEALEDMRVGTVINRTRMPAWGLNGGEQGLPAELAISIDGGEWQPLEGAITGRPIPAGTRVRKRTGGGGGWGPPVPSASARPQGKQ